LPESPNCFFIKKRIHLQADRSCELFRDKEVGEAAPAAAGQFAYVGPSVRKKDERAKLSGKGEYITLSKSKILASLLKAT
jgi:hypothetical protein